MASGASSAGRGRTGRTRAQALAAPVRSTARPSGRPEVEFFRRGTLGSFPRLFRRATLTGGTELAVQRGRRDAAAGLLGAIGRQVQRRRRAARR